MKSVEKRTIPSLSLKLNLEKPLPSPPTNGTQGLKVTSVTQQADVLSLPSKARKNLFPMKPPNFYIEALTMDHALEVVGIWLSLMTVVTIGPHGLIHSKHIIQ